MTLSTSREILSGAQNLLVPPFVPEVKPSTRHLQTKLRALQLRWSLTGTLPTRQTRLCVVPSWSPLLALSPDRLARKALKTFVNMCPWVGLTPWLNVESVLCIPVTVKLFPPVIYAENRPLQETKQLYRLCMHRVALALLLCNLLRLLLFTLLVRR